MGYSITSLIFFEEFFDSQKIYKFLFLKFVIRENRKLPYTTLTVFLGKLHQNFFVFHFTYTGDTP